MFLSAILYECYITRVLYDKKVAAPLNHSCMASCTSCFLLVSNVESLEDSMNPRLPNLFFKSGECGFALTYWTLSFWSLLLIILGTDNQAITISLCGSVSIPLRREHKASASNIVYIGSEFERVPP